MNPKSLCILISSAFWALATSGESPDSIKKIAPAALSTFKSPWDVRAWEPGSRRFWNGTASTSPALDLHSPEAALKTRFFIPVAGPKSPPQQKLKNRSHPFDF